MRSSTSLGVADLKWCLRRYELETALHHSTVSTGTLEEVYCRIRFSDGTVGTSEVRGNGGYATGESTQLVTGVLAEIAEAAARSGGIPVDPIELRGRSRLAAMAVDVAAWDARATRRGEPLYRTLGASSPVESWPTHLPIPFCDDDTAERRAAAARDAGFTRLKMRLGEGVERDRHRIELVRRTAGDSIELIADANGGWSLETAQQMLPILDAHAVTWIEQPVSDIDDLTTLAQVPRHVRVRADESAHCAQDIVLLADRHAVEGVHLKLEKAGTIAVLRDQIALARARGLDVALGQMDQSRLGCALTTHLAVGFGIAEAELWGCADIIDDRTGPLICRGGAVVVPQGPGIGVHADLGERDEEERHS